MIMQYLLILRGEKGNLFTLSDEIITDCDVDIVHFRENGKIFQMVIHGKEDDITRLVEKLKQSGLKHVDKIPLSDTLNMDKFLDFLPLFIKLEKMIVRVYEKNKLNHNVQDKFKKFFQVYDELKSAVGVNYPITLLYLTKMMKNVDECLKLVCFYHNVDLKSAKRVLETLCQEKFIKIRDNIILFSLKGAIILEMFKKLIIEVLETLH